MWMLDLLLHNIRPGWFLLFASVFTVMCHFIEKYVFDDWAFVVFVFVLIGWDTLLGLIYHTLHHTLSSRGFSSLFVKVIVYCSFLSATHVATNFTIQGETNHIFGWINYFTYSAVIIREFMSIIEHIGRLSPEALPSWLIKIFKNFDETGRYTPTDKT